MKYMHFVYNTSDPGFSPDTYMELDEERWQTKAIGVNGENGVVYAYGDIEQGTFLAEAPYPEPEEVNSPTEEEFFLEYITREEFYEIWDKYVSLGE